MIRTDTCTLDGTLPACQILFGIARTLLTIVQMGKRAEVGIPTMQDLDDMVPIGVVASSKLSPTYPVLFSEQT